MPVYEFRCETCRESFSVTESFKEHAEHREKCPKCGSQRVKQQMSPVYAKTSRKS